MEKNWEKIVTWYSSCSKKTKAFIAFIIITALFGSFGWSEHHWTSGGSFGVAFLMQLIPGTIAFFYFLVCWAADEKKKNAKKI